MLGKVIADIPLFRMGVSRGWLQIAITLLGLLTKAESSCSTVNGNQCLASFKLVLTICLLVFLTATAEGGP